MDGVGYRGDHDFMAPDGTAFARLDITVRLGDKFIHENKEYIATECYSICSGDSSNAEAHRWFIEPEQDDSAESLPDTEFRPNYNYSPPKATKIIVTVDKSTGEIILAENLPKGYQLIIKML